MARVEPVLQVVAALGEVPNPVRYPDLYATVDRLYRTGLARDALGDVVRWLLRGDLASLRAGGLHLTSEVDGIAQRARAVLEAPDRAGRSALVTALGLDLEDPRAAVDDRAARLLLAPPVPAGWPAGPTRTWSLLHATILAAASRLGTITAARVRQLWFETESTECDPEELLSGARDLAAAGIVTARSGRLGLTRAGRRCRALAHRRLSRLDGPWSGDQPVWAALAALAEISRPDGWRLPDTPALTAWLGEPDTNGRHTRS